MVARGFVASAPPNMSAILCPRARSGMSCLWKRFGLEKFGVQEFVKIRLVCAQVLSPRICVKGEGRVEKRSGKPKWKTAPRRRVGVHRIAAIVSACGAVSPSVVASAVGENVRAPGRLRTCGRCCWAPLILIAHSISCAHNTTSSRGQKGGRVFTVGGLGFSDFYS